MDTFDAINQRRSTLTDLLDPLGDCMTPEVAKKVVQLRASADANSRMQLLAGKSAAGTLTDEERGVRSLCVGRHLHRDPSSQGPADAGPERSGLMDVRLRSCFSLLWQK
jgi:hypothetical protein